MWKSLVEKVVLGIGAVHWKNSNPLNEQEKAQIKSLLGPNYYIILTRRKNHLSTFFVGLTNLALRGKWGYYSHSLMNLENENDGSQFKLIEAISKGVVETDFDEVFDCHSVALLKPKSMSIQQWTTVLDKAKSELGKPYDSLFDLKSDSSLSCVELVRTSLSAEPNYANDFANFEKMIKRSRNLTPQMFYDCPDFEVVFEIRK